MSLFDRISYSVDEESNKHLTVFKFDEKNCEIHYDELKNIPNNQIKEYRALDRNKFRHFGMLLFNIQDEEYLMKIISYMMYINYSKKQSLEGLYNFKNNCLKILNSLPF